MDFAFAPGTGDLAINFLRTAWKARSDMTVFDAAGIATLADFLGAADAVTVLAPPPDNLIIGCHGDDAGHMLIALDSANTAPADFEKLQNAQTSKSIVIPSDVMTPSLTVRLAACQIGSDETLPVLTQLKQTMGNPKNVIAPRFIHAFSTFPSGEYVEWMQYTFRVISKTALATRDAVVGQFGNLNPVQVDGTTAIPPESWQQWVPPAASLTLNPAPGSAQQFDFDYFTLLKPPPAMYIISLYKGMATWVSSCDVLHTMDVNVTGTMPPDDAGKLALLKQAVLAKFPSFQDTHPYPVYKRFFYNTLDDLFAGFNWKITVSGTTISYSGTRFRYELWTPVTVPGTSTDLVFNYYPSSGGTPTIHFDESNTPYKMFGIV